MRSPKGKGKRKLGDGYAPMTQEILCKGITMDSPEGVIRAIPLEMAKREEEEAVRENSCEVIWGFKAEMNQNQLLCAQAGKFVQH
jgi:hypothetical protein